MTVTREQRHTKDHPCPICGGFDRAPRGQGVRCGGFNDGEWGPLHPGGARGRTSP